MISLTGGVDNNIKHLSTKLICNLVNKFTAKNFENADKIAPFIKT